MKPTLDSERGSLYVEDSCRGCAACFEWSEILFDCALCIIRGHVKTQRIEADRCEFHEGINVGLGQLNERSVSILFV